MDNLWKDTSGEGYPEINDGEFVPTFIRENKKTMDSLAEMMLEYDFNYYIDFYEYDVRIIIREENVSEEKKNRFKEDIQHNEQLISYVSVLLEFEYIFSLRRTDADGESVFIDFSDMLHSTGPISRGARYIPEKVLNEHMRKEEYLERYHVIGNWFYMTSGKV